MPRTRRKSIKSAQPPQRPPTETRCEQFFRISQDIAEPLLCISLIILFYAYFQSFIVLVAPELRDLQSNVLGTDLLHKMGPFLNHTKAFVHHATLLWDHYLGWLRIDVNKRCVAVFPLFHRVANASS